MNKAIPKIYLEQTRPLLMDGASGDLWARDLLLDFLNDPVCQEFAVLGGDVFLEQNGEVSFTYDSWWADRRSPNESFIDYAKKCRELTIAYLRSYPVQDGIYFCPVVSTELTSGM